MIKTERFCDFCGNSVERFAAIVTTIPLGAQPPAVMTNPPKGLETCQECLDTLFAIKQKRIKLALKASDGS